MSNEKPKLPYYGGGRKKAALDPVQLEKLCMMQCPLAEIAAWFGVATKTIERRAKEPKFAELLERGKQKGRIAIRRALMDQVQKGNMTAIIWAGKNILGYRDSVDAQISGSIEIKEIKVSFITPTSPIVP